MELEPLFVLKDTDIFENSIQEPKFYFSRPTVKGIIIDDQGDIALLHARGHYLFPGGGVEKGETLGGAFIRECKEEIGCDVFVIDYLGRYDEYRAVPAKRYEIIFFIARVMGEKGIPTTKDTGEQTVELVWEKKERVLELLTSQLAILDEEEYPLQFNARTHLIAFQHFLEQWRG